MTTKTALEIMCQLKNKIDIVLIADVISNTYAQVI